MTIRNDESIVCTAIPNSKPKEWACVEHTGRPRGTIERINGCYKRPDYDIKTDKTTYYDIPKYWMFQVIG